MAGVGSSFIRLSKGKWCNPEGSIEEISVPADFWVMAEKKKGVLYAGFRNGQISVFLLVGYNGEAPENYKSRQNWRYTRIPEKVSLCLCYALRDVAGWEYDWENSLTWC